MKDDYRPNYGKALASALKLLDHCKLHSLPIRLGVILHRLGNIKLCSYSHLAEIHNYSEQEIIALFGSELGFCTACKANRIIYYNDYKKHAALARFTIAHELGHCVLGHFEMISSDSSVMLRGGLLEGQYDALEKEANSFARNLLAPSPLVEMFGGNALSLPEMSNIFNISLAAAYTRRDRLGADQCYISKSAGEKFIERFLHLKDARQYGKKCSVCGHFFIHVSAEYCPVCGTWGLINGSLGGTMKYEGIDVDTESRCLQCPKCNNEEMENGEYCKICGAHVVNRCTGGETDFNGNFLECGYLAKGNARYCIICGSKTTFLKNGLLASCDKKGSECSEDDDNNLPF